MSNHTSAIAFYLQQYRQGYGDDAFHGLLELERGVFLRLLHTEDATAAVAPQPTDLDQQSLAAADQLRSRRLNLNFVEMGIPVSELLQSTRDGTTVTVVGPKKVKLGDDELSLSAATRQVLGTDYSVQPGPH